MLSHSIRICGVVAEEQQLIWLQLILKSHSGALNGIVVDGDAFSAGYAVLNAQCDGPGMGMTGKNAKGIGDHRSLQGGVVAQTDREIYGAGGKCSLSDFGVAVQADIEELAIVGGSEAVGATADGPGVDDGGRIDSDDLAGELTSGVLLGTKVLLGG
jgi:hypothetical protein